MPNFAPVIAAKVGDNVFERQLPCEDMMVAQEAASHVLDEWPDAEIVVVIADAAIRENGKRTDVFDLKIENRTAGRAAALFQRYRVASGGGVELIGRPTAMAAERFLLAAGAFRESAPDEVLTALARQALDTIVTSLTVVEPSGMCSDDPEDELLSPSALIGTAGDEHPLTVRFMMQGPITAARSCYASLQEKPAEWVVFHVDDLVFKNGSADRRLSCVSNVGRTPALRSSTSTTKHLEKASPSLFKAGLNSSAGEDRCFRRLPSFAAFGEGHDAAKNLSRLSVPGDVFDDRQPLPRATRLWFGRRVV